MTPDIASAQTQVTAPPLLPGYEILDVLGRGGMGSVYRCRQLSLNRIVAVKVLAAELAEDPDFVKRFEKESAALAALGHPNIISIIDRGREGKTSFFAMEYVEGGSLRQLMDQGPILVDRALRIVTQVCNAVQSAHARGVIHRDLKPENILMGPDGAPKIADFGLAGMTVPDAPQLTRPAVAMGTAQYMAPEQRRDARSVDLRADIYSLGVMLYEILTGEVPVGRFRPPSEKRAGVDPRVDAIVLRMLEADPDRRFPDARSVALALEEMLATNPGRPQRAVHERSALRTRRLWRWWILALAVAAAAALAVGLVAGRGDRLHRSPAAKSGAR